MPLLPKSGFGGLPSHQPETQAKRQNFPPPKFCLSFFPNEEIKKRFSDADKEMLEVTLENARKEDEKLFSYLIDKKVKIVFRD